MKSGGTYLRSKRVIENIRVRLGTTAAKKEEAVELFEFALVGPLLLTLLLGIVWLGRAYNVYETITRAAREGARYAVLPNWASQGNTYPDTPSSACATNTNAYNNYVKPVLLAGDLDTTQVQNYCQKTQWLTNTGDDPPECGVVISFSYPVTLAIPFTTLNAATINIPTQVQMRQENQPTGGTCP